MSANTHDPHGEPVAVTLASFETDVVQSPIPVVVDFWATWCPPCRALDPVLEQLARTYAGRVKVAKVNVDQEQELAARFQVSAVPTVAGMVGPDVVDVRVGFGGRGALEKLFERLAKEALGAAHQAPAALVI